MQRTHVPLAGNPGRHWLTLTALLIAGLAGFAGLGVLASPALAQVVDDDLYVTNGGVFSMAISGNTLYVGGDFTQVGPPTGGFVPTDAASGALVSGFPKVNGPLVAIASDGAGGWCRVVAQPLSAT